MVPLAFLPAPCLTVRRPRGAVGHRGPPLVGALQSRRLPAASAAAPSRLVDGSGGGGGGGSGGDGGGGGGDGSVGVGDGGGGGGVIDSAGPRSAAAAAAPLAPLRRPLAAPTDDIDVPVTDGIAAVAVGGGGMPPPATSGLPPLYAALAAEAARVRAPFFCPGHKLGRGAPAGLAAAVPPATLSLDLPELPALDCLSAPSGVLATAAAAAADAFTPGGAAVYASHLLVNGSSGGLVAAVLAAVAPGQTLLLPRNAHSSAVAALVASGGVPRWVEPVVADGLAAGVTTDAVAAGLAAAAAAGEDVAAVLVVAPTYHGVVADIAGIAQVVAAHETAVGGGRGDGGGIGGVDGDGCDGCGGGGGVALIVDEAHGAHFGLAPGLPSTATAAGADAVIQSTHKTGGSLTQTALLHVRRAAAGGRLDADAVADALAVGTTTSPSWLLLGSLDAAVAWAASPAAATEWSSLLRTAADARRQLSALPGVNVMGLPRGPELAGWSLDPSRLTLLLDAAVFPGGGWDVDDALIERWGVYAELPTAAAITFVLTPANGVADVDALVSAMATLAAEGVAAAAVAPNAVPPGKGASPSPPPPPARAVAAGILPRGPPAMTPRDAFFAAKEAVPLAAADGRVAAETVSVYPPGIPLVVLGEVITPAVAAALAAAGAGGGGVSVTGAANPSLATLRVVAEGGGGRRRRRVKEG